MLDAASPKTIHDFWGFPEELYQISYACPGAPELAGQVRSLISTVRVEPDSEWGLDHGSWVCRCGSCSPAPASPVCS